MNFLTGFLYVGCFKGSEKHLFCIRLKVGAVLGVKPINDFACESFGKLTVHKGVIYEVWLTTVDAVTICSYPISAKFFSLY